MTLLSMLNFKYKSSLIRHQKDCNSFQCKLKAELYDKQRVELEERCNELKELYDKQREMHDKQCELQEQINNSLVTQTTINNVNINKKFLILLSFITFNILKYILW